MGDIRTHLWGSPKRAVATSLATGTLILIAFLLMPVLRDWSFVGFVIAPFWAVSKLFPSETQQFLGRLFGQLSFASTAMEREAVRNDLEGTLAMGARDINAQCEQAVPAGVRVEFLKDRESVRTLPDGTIVLGVAHHRDRVRNLVAAAWAFSRYAVIPGARRHLDGEVSKGLDLVITKELLLREDRSAIRQFFVELWEPSIRDAERLQRLAAMLDQIHEEGFLGPVALAEFVDMGLVLATRLPSPAIAEETARFVEYLHGVATHEPEQSVPRSFDGQIFRCIAFYVARPDVSLLGGPDPSIRSLNQAIDAGYKAIYLLARGRQVDYLSQLCDQLDDDARLRRVTRHSGTVRTTSGVIKKQLIVRVVVDWRVFTSIGQRPYVAAGALAERRLRERLRQR